jgi:hypothetical protein
MEPRNALPSNGAALASSTERPASGGPLNRFLLLGIGAALISLFALWLARDGGVPSTQSDAGQPSVGPQLPVETPPPTSSEQLSAESRADAPQSVIARKEPNIFTVMDGRSFPEVESSPWSDGMERTILSYVSQHQFLALTDLEVQCEVSGCVIFMGGRNIPIHELQFGAFAKEQGFEFVAIRDRDGTSGHIVVLRR